MLPNPLEISIGETLLFGVVAVFMVVLTVFGLLITRRAVHTIICVIFTMVGFAVLYTMLEAPFMGVAQIVVYTGAILMMFLFVLMLIGVDSADSGLETLKAQRPVAVLGGIGILAILTGIVLGAATPNAIGLEMANAETNPMGVAKIIFSNHVLTLQLTGTLLVVAALGAMTLTHRDRMRKKETQEEIANRKVEEFVAGGAHIGHRPNPGVYAESNSSANPALTADSTAVPGSTNRVLQVRGQVRKVSEISPRTAERIERTGGIAGPATYGKIGRPTIPGMPGGETAPDYVSAARELDPIDDAPTHDDIPTAKHVAEAEKTRVETDLPADSAEEKN